MPNKELSERMQALINYILCLDPEKRHYLTIECRGNEPWQIIKIETRKKIELKPEPRSKSAN